MVGVVKEGVRGGEGFGEAGQSQWLVTSCIASKYNKDSKMRVGINLSLEDL